MPKTLRVAFLLAFAEIRKSSVLTNSLIIFIMTLTFINLLFGRGILTGLPKGASDGYKNNYSGDVLITNLDNENYIQHPNEIYKLLDSTDYVKDYTVRYVTPMFITGDYNKSLKDQTRIFTEVALVDLNKESKYFLLDKKILDGKYENSLLILGSSLLSEYSATEGIGDTTINNVKVGDKVALIYNNNILQEPVSGVIKSKVRQVERRVYLNKKDYIRLVGPSYQDTAKEIAVILNNNVTPEYFKTILVSKEIDKLASIKTFNEAQPQFVNDIKTTFSILGDIIGSVGLIISCITVFIIIYINAISKRRNIGILKGVGISSSSIELSFVIQAVIYALIGASVGTIIVVYLLVPYFNSNPIDFPFADGFLVAPKNEVAVRFLVLVVASAISGFLPAYLITKEKTINSILGR